MNHHNIIIRIQSESYVHNYFHIFATDSDLICSIACVLAGDVGILHPLHPRCFVKYLLYISQPVSRALYKCGKRVWADIVKWTAPHIHITHTAHQTMKSNGFEFCIIWFLYNQESYIEITYLCTFGEHAGCTSELRCWWKRTRTSGRWILRHFIYVGGIKYTLCRYGIVGVVRPTTTICIRRLNVDGCVQEGEKYTKLNL